MIGKWIANLLSDSGYTETLQVPEVVQSPHSLKRMLEVERMRTDRSGWGFCLVKFDLSQHRQDNQALNTILEIIPQNIRTTDYVGFLNRSEIGVVLWHTPKSGALQFVKKIMGKMPKELSPQTQIFTYPEESDTPPSDPTERTSTVEPVSSEDSYFDRGDELATETVQATSVLTKPRSILQAQKTKTEKRIEQTFVRIDTLINSFDESPEEVSVKSLSQFYAKRVPAWKRGLDLIGAGVGLILLSPVFLLSAIAVKCSSRGPVFFFQERTGLGGAKFKMAKFRTMVQDAEGQKQQLIELNEQDGPAFKIDKDPRITRVGKFLRAFSIDELPQLWNVIRGDMTLVGPRPLPCSEAAACTGWQRRRLDVTPGLTCIWQIKDRRNKIPFAEWVRMDLQYIERRSLIKDLFLILQTIRTVVRRKGI